MEFEKLVLKFDIKTIIETGTYLGDTTKTICSMVENVHTIESCYNNYLISVENLKTYKNIVLHFGHSQDILRTLIPQKIKKPIMFFLDAHGEDYNPLLEELNIIGKYAKDSIIAIHDFLVPNHSELGFDYFPILQNGIKIGCTPLHFNLIKHDIKECFNGYNYYYNDISEGANRGIIYIYPEPLDPNKEMCHSNPTLVKNSQRFRLNL